MVSDSNQNNELTELELDKLLDDLADALFSKWLAEINRSDNMKTHDKPK